MTLEQHARRMIASRHAPTSRAGYRLLWIFNIPHNDLFGPL